MRLSITIDPADIGIICDPADIGIICDPADMGIICAALRDEAERAARNRDILASAGDYESTVKSADHRVAVLTAAADQIADGYIRARMDQMLAGG